MEGGVVDEKHVLILPFLSCSGMLIVLRLFEFIMEKTKRSGVE